MLVPLEERERIQGSESYRLIAVKGFVLAMDEPFSIDSELRGEISHESNRRLLAPIKVPQNIRYPLCMNSFGNM
ncbi:hypothetical protein NC77_02430 [Janthinobacterium lividum]|nr:hypothetical protein NC77_02430 [Janthinobacterium lividum]